MGSSVKASCKCGYEQEFAIGGGMMSFQELCWFPCLCRGCKRIVQANLLQTPLTCPECKSGNIAPYDQPDLCQQQGSNVVTSWNLTDEIGREVKLTDGVYYCPACDSYHLIFEDSGLCWD